MILRFLFAIILFLALTLLTLQLFLTPNYLEFEYEFSRFPSATALSIDERYIAAQGFLSYLNVELGGATYQDLSELSFGARRFFNDADMACILHAKQLRGFAFSLTFFSGAIAIAIALFMAVQDFHRARRIVMQSAFVILLVYTGLNVVNAFAFPTIATWLLSIFAQGDCVAAEVNGLPRLFPSAIVRDAFILLAFLVRAEALLILLIGWIVGLVMRPKA